MLGATVVCTDGGVYGRGGSRVYRAVVRKSVRGLWGAEAAFTEGRARSAHRAFARSHVDGVLDLLLGLGLRLGLGLGLGLGLDGVLDHAEGGVDHQRDLPPRGLER